jgi:hypothetical protein
MSAFRRVEGEEAGPRALGILVPPNRRTFLIVRPRSLPWDLVAARDDGTAFHEMSREEASGQALRLFRALREWAEGGPGEVAEAASEDGRRLTVRAGVFLLVVCGREPGKPYRAESFADPAALEDARRELLAVLRPGPEAEQEVYFNTRHFSAT